MDPDLIKKSETQHNAQVKQLYFESDETKDEILLATNAKGYDVVLGSGASILPYLKQDWIVPLNTQNIPNIKHIYPRWRNAYSDISGYAGPYIKKPYGIEKIGVSIRSELDK